MKRIIVIVLCTGLLAPAGLLAQEVYKDASNKVVLDLTTTAGMPAGAQTSASKTSIYAGHLPTDVGWHADNKEEGSLNATVFERLEVAPHDLDNSGNITNGSSGWHTWMGAYTYCLTESYGGGGWRLPTYRELLLIYVFKDALENIFADAAVAGTAFNTGSYYWSATEGDAATLAWVVSLGFGYTGYGGKSATRTVRCVRELP